MLISTNIYNQIKKVLPIVCVDLLIIQDNKLLLLKRNNSPAYGQWWFPGGRIFKNETLFDAAVRKGMEEIGVKLSPVKVISVEESIFNEISDEVDIHTINVVIQMKYDSAQGEIILDSNHSEYKWFEEIDVKLHPAVLNPLMKINFKIK